MKWTRPSRSIKTLPANNKYGKRFKSGNAPLPPGRRLAVVACMDSRLTVEQVLGLSPGDAHIIRNAGGLITEDAVRSLIISTQLLGTRTIYVIQHTDCGMLTFRDQELRDRLAQQTGKDASHLHFHSFTDLQSSVARQIQLIREIPFLPKDIDVHGFLFDVRTGKLQEIGLEAGKAAVRG
ncbi:MAG: carbonic anhydrase [Acidobacteriia bacterium]|nr:carbonic anhydrase [Terriglobia bacterium]